MRIRDIRKLTGLTQAAFAKKYSISLPTLQHWERDYTKPPDYFIKLLEQSLGSDASALSYYIGKHGETYIYDTVTKTVSDMDGDKVQITETFERVKKENAGLYLSELFDAIHRAKELFQMDCDEDLRSDIIWEEN